jgi:hypothetical protein
VQNSHDPDRIRVHFVKHPVATDENLTDLGVVEVRDDS